MSYELGILGAGNMAEAIARGVIGAKLFQPSQIIAADVSAERRNLFQDNLKIKAVESNAEVVRQSKVILLSVKPQQMAEVLASVRSVLDDQTLIISIAAGISTAFIEKNLGSDRNWRVIRTMPNTPMLVNEGMVAMAAGSHANPEDLDRARQIFAAAADVIEVSEDQIDAVTAVSGSGPAYFFILVEQMIAAGVDMGLSPQDARTLAAKTALGAAKMLLTSSDAPQELRRKVTSPNGTTHAAITHMESHDWPSITRQAVKAAGRRSKELGV